VVDAVPINRSLFEHEGQTGFVYSAALWATVRVSRTATRRGSFDNCKGVQEYKRKGRRLGRLMSSRMDESSYGWLLASKIDRRRVWVESSDDVETRCSRS